MKPTDPTPEEYTKWIMDELAKCEVSHLLGAANLILTELFNNSTTELNKLYFNECLTELKKL